MEKKVLVIDDEKYICDLLKGFLEDRGWRVITATSTREGLRKTRDEKPSIVLLDIKMPFIDGIKAIKLLKRIDQAIDIIMISGVVDQNIVRRSMDYGAVEYILKPFTLEYVKNCINVRMAIKGAF